MNFLQAQEKLIQKKQRWENRYISYPSFLVDFFLKRIEKKQNYIENKRQFYQEQISSIFKSFLVLEKYYKEYQLFTQYLEKTEEQKIFSLLSKIKPLAHTNDFFLLDEEKKEKARILTLQEKIDTFFKDYNKIFIAKAKKDYPTIFSKLSEEQCLAVLKEAKYQLVIAGAGSGKTSVLAAKIAWVCQKKDPKRILAISYTKNAAEVMEKRIESQFNIKVEVKTFHALGYKIVQQASLTKKQVFTGDLEEWIEQACLENCENSFFEEKYWKWIEDFTQKLPSFFSLKGENYKNSAEKTIADFLFLHSLAYQTKKPTEWAPQYYPLFYLPEYGIAIELEDPASSKSQFEKKFKEKMLQKHPDKKILFIKQNQSKEEIKKQLSDFFSHCSIPLRKMFLKDYILHYEDVFRKIQEQTRDIFAAFIRNAKTLNKKAPQILEEKTRYSAEITSFIDVACFLLEKYEEFLEKNQLFDFSDMIYQAIAIMKQNPALYQSLYDYILIDEFQDISADRIAFIQQIAPQESKTKIFCVGDDWQSIYSFNGSEVDFFVNFEKYFGEAEKTFLTRNYRCPISVIEAGNHLLEYNQHKIEKKIQAVNTNPTPLFLYVFPKSNARIYEERQTNYAVDLISRWLEEGIKPEEILVLSRYNRFLTPIENLLKKKNTKEIEKIRFFSIHKSKGDEAERVLLLQMTEGIWGFPSFKQENKYLEPVKIGSENYWEEERRLFYVALTRTKGEIHLFSREDAFSPFLQEIKSYLTRREVT